VTIPNLPSNAAPSNADIVVTQQQPSARNGDGTVSTSIAQIDATADTVSNKKIIENTRVVTASGAITVGTTDYNVCADLGTPAAIAVNLPATPVTGNSYTISDCAGNAATYNLTVTPAAGNIDGSGTYLINTNWGSWSGYYNGTEWKTRSTLGTFNSTVNANLIYAGPSSGSAAAAAFRAMALADLPSIATGSVLGYFGAGSGPPAATPAILINTGNSGGVLCFTGSSALASSTALTATELIIGGGAGACPTSLTGSGVPVLFSGVVTVNAVLPAADGGCDNPVATSNTRCGQGAMANITTGTQDFALGNLAGNNITTGQDDIAIGYNALAQATGLTGNNITAIGANAANGCTGACGNVTAVGQSAGGASTGQQNSTFVGNGVGALTCASGGGNVLIGGSSGTDCEASGTNNEVNIAGKTIFEYNQLPTLTSGGGTGTTSFAGNGTAFFKFVEGTTGSPSTTLVLAMPPAHVDWICSAFDRTSSSITARQSGSPSTTALTITFSSAPANSDVIQFHCGAY
jgi:hypothetical protein